MFETKITNPILRGFNPDPNILRVGDVYYIIVSSFEWLPGVRVYQSKNLVNWEHCTDILTDQVDLRGNPLNGSIWAPQISYFNGEFYLLYTDVKSTRRPFKDCHNYLMKSADIRGPWSDPIYLTSCGFDPSLFHDEDGRSWLLAEIWDYRLQTGNKSAGIVLQEFDKVNNELIGEVYKIFDGTELAKTEAPHIYKHQGWYYLVTAEGGTGSDHSVTICRSRSITGPYELDPDYPMLTASDKPDSVLQCSGHGSLVQTKDNDWFMVYLCTRPIDGKYAVLGRETAIQEVFWTSDGWLKLKDGGNGPSHETRIMTKEPIKQQISTNFYDNFNRGLQKEWNALRIMPTEDWCDFKSRPGFLRIHSGESIQSLFEQHLLAIRQKDFYFIAETAVEFSPETYNQMAGLMLYLNDLNYLYIYVTYDEKLGKTLRLIKSENGEYYLYEDIIPLDKEKTWLRVKASGIQVQFEYKETEMESWKQVLDTQDIRYLSGGFTGNFVGIAVHDMDKKDNIYGDFEYFDYQGLDH